MAFGIRIKKDASNQVIIKKIGPAATTKARGRALQKFAIFIFRALVIKSQQLTKQRTGTYSRSWKVTALKVGLAIVNRAKSAKGFFYPEALEFGTKAHSIAPKKGREGLHGKPPALAFPKKGGGPMSASKGKFNPANFFFSKGHKVKGIKARLVVAKVLKESADDWNRIYADELTKELTA